MRIYIPDSEDLKTQKCLTELEVFKHYVVSSVDVEQLERQLNKIISILENLESQTESLSFARDLVSAIGEEDEKSLIERTKKVILSVNTTRD